MMNRHLLAALFVLASAIPAPANAQTSQDRDAVKAAVVDYVEGFYEGDTAKLVRSIRPEVAKYGFDWIAKDGKYVGEPMSWNEVLGYARRFKANNRITPAAAPRKVDVLDVLDQTASAKLTAWWGTDYVLLAKYDGKWMITHVLWQSPPPKTP